MYIHTHISLCINASDDVESSVCAARMYTFECECVWIKFAHKRLNDLAGSFQTRIGLKGECSSLDS